MMKQFGHVILILTAAILCFAGPAFSDTEVKPEGKVYAHYYYNISGYPDWYGDYAQNDYNGFDITRVYFGAKIKLTDHWNMRVLSDIARESSYEIESIDEDEDGEIDNYELDENKKSGKFGMYIKYAYLDYAPYDLLAVRGGLHGTPWAGFVDKYWGYRFVAKSLTDKYKLNSSADLGVSLHGKLPSKFGGYQFMVMNGEGYKHPEQNEGKATHFRLNLTPLNMVDALKHLTLAGSARYEKKDPDIESTYLLYTALLHYKYEINEDMNFGLGFEYAGASEQPRRDAEDVEIVQSMGYSAFGQLSFPYGLAMFGRYDFFDPDTENDEDEGIGYQDETSYIVAGISYKPIKYVMFALNYQMTGYTEEVVDDEGENTTKPSDNFIFLNSEFKF